MSGDDDDSVLARLPESIREAVLACRRALAGLDTGDQAAVVAMLTAGITAKTLGEASEAQAAIEEPSDGGRETDRDPA
jgi:hypothetical protein